MRGRWGSAFWGVLLIPFGGIELVILFLDWKRTQVQEDDMTTQAADRISAVLQDEGRCRLFSTVALASNRRTANR